MKIYQPAAVVGFSFGGALLLSSLLSFRYAVVFLIAAGLPFIGFLIFCLVKGFHFSRGVVCVALFMVILGAAVNVTQRAYCARESAKFPLSPVEVTGTVEQVFPVGGQMKSYLLKTEEIGAPEISQKLRLLLYGTNDCDFHAGERVACKVTGFRSVPTRSQTGKGAQAAGWIEAGSQSIVAKAPAVSKWMEGLVSRLKVNIKKAVPSPYDTVLIAMLLGDSSEMDEGIYDSFHLTGISHILCVSGLHITLIGGLIAGLFQLIFGKRIFADIMGLAAMIFFVTLTGGSPSSVRALVMAAVLMLTRHIVRDYSPVNTLGGVVLFFCILEPYIVYHKGFLMSVLSVCALCVVSPRWTRRCSGNFPSRTDCSSISCPFSAPPVR